MSIQYVIAGVLLVGGQSRSGLAPSWCSRGWHSVPSGERRWVQAFGVGLIVCGATVLVATLLGFRGQPIDELPAP